MKIVINIPGEMYKSVSNNDAYVLGDVDWILLENAIANGTPLPEIHGRLGDLDELEQRINNFIEHDAHMVDEYTLTRERFILDGIRNTHTIIEADKEE